MSFWPGDKAVRLAPVTFGWRRADRARSSPAAERGDWPRPASLAGACWPDRRKTPAAFADLPHGDSRPEALYEACSRDRAWRHEFPLERVHWFIGDEPLCVGCTMRETNMTRAGIFSGRNGAPGNPTSSNFPTDVANQDELRWARYEAEVENRSTAL